MDFQAFAEGKSEDGAIPDAIGGKIACFAVVLWLNHGHLTDAGQLFTGQHFDGPHTADDGFEQDLAG